jgi:hypothetical protein
VANVWNTSGDMERDDEQPAEVPQPVTGADLTEEEESDDLELDDPTIDEAGLPALDMEDAEALAQDHRYEDLLDHRWLERGADAEEEDEDRSIEEVGLTIDIDDLADEEDGAQVVDLDVGSLLTSLPSEGTELDLDPGPLHGDGSLALGALRDMLLPDDQAVDSDDREVGDDERFPAFDDSSDIAPRPLHEEDADAGAEDLP